jgi:hypothetical protein
MKHGLLIGRVVLAGLFLVFAWRIISVSTATPKHYAGAGSPMGACIVGDKYVSTTEQRVYECIPRKSWKPVAEPKTCEERGLAKGCWTRETPNYLGKECECFTTGGNRVDSQGRFNARGDYTIGQGGYVGSHDRHAPLRLHHQHTGSPHRIAVRQASVWRCAIDGRRGDNCGLSAKWRTRKRHCRGMTYRYTVSLMAFAG